LQGSKEIPYIVSNVNVNKILLEETTSVKFHKPGLNVLCDITFLFD